MTFRELLGILIPAAFLAFALYWVVIRDPYARERHRARKNAKNTEVSDQWKAWKYEDPPYADGQRRDR